MKPALALLACVGLALALAPARSRAQDTPDAGTPDASTPDASTPDASTSDASTPPNASEASPPRSGEGGARGGDAEGGGSEAREPRARARGERRGAEPPAAEEPPERDTDDPISQIEAELDEEEAAGETPEAASEEDENAPPDLPLFGETTFSLVDTTITELRSNDFEDDQYLSGDALAWTVIERLELAMQGENLRLSTRIDAFVPILEPDGCSTMRETLLCDLEWDLRPERVNLLWTPGDFDIQLGDSHAVLARGIALSMRKVDQLGIDNTVRGGYAQYDGGHLYARLLGGVANPQNLDPVNLTIRGRPRDVFGDPLDILIGAEAGFRAGESNDLELGVHGARIWFEADPVRQERVVATVYGWHASAPSLLDGALALYGEVDALLREDEDPGLLQQRFWGRAVYASAQVSSGNVSVLGQWKDYRNFLVAPFGSPPEYRIYSAQPSLDRDTERFRGIHNSRGGSLEVTYAFAPSPWSLTATGIVYGEEDDDASIDPWDGILVTHGVLSLAKKSSDVAEGEVGWALDAAGGYRRETYLRNQPSLLASTGDLDWEVIHGEVDGSIGFGQHGIELRVEQRFERRRLFDIVEYVRGGVTLTWAFAGRLYVSPELLWSTEKVPEPDLYPGVEVRWVFTEGSHVRLFVGQRPGGRVCSGGLCRDVPPFEGGLLELVVRNLTC